MKQRLYFSTEEAEDIVGVGEKTLTYWAKELRIRVRQKAHKKKWSGKQVGLLQIMRKLCHDHGMSGHTAGQFLLRGGKLHLGELDERTAEGLVKMYRNKKVILTVEEDASEA